MKNLCELICLIPPCGTSCGKKTMVHSEFYLPHPNIPLRERDGNVIFAEETVDLKAHVAADVLDLEEFPGPEEELEIEGRVAEIHETDERRRFFQGFGVRFGYLQ